MASTRTVRDPVVTLRRAVFAIGAAVLIAALGGGYYFGSAPVAPQVVDLPLDAAAQRLADEGISVDIGDAHGTVTAQHPTAGERVMRYRHMTLTYVDEAGTHTLGG